MTAMSVELLLLNLFTKKKTVSLSSFRDHSMNEYLCRNVAPCHGWSMCVCIMYNNLAVQHNSARL